MSPLIQIVLLTFVLATPQSYLKRKTAKSVIEVAREPLLTAANTWNFNNGTSTQGIVNSDSTQTKSTLSGIPTATFTAIPYPSSNVSHSENVQPKPTLNLAYRNPGKDGPQIVDIEAKLKGNAVALENVGGIQSVYCSQETIRIQFDPKEPEIPEHVATVWPRSLPFYLSTNHPGCQGAKKAQVHCVKSITWSSDKTEATLEKETVPLVKALEGMNGRFGDENENKKSQLHYDVTNIPLERPETIGIAQLKVKNHWTKEELQNIESILFFDETLDVKYGISTMKDAGPQDGSMLNHRPVRGLKRRGGQHSKERTPLLTHREDLWTTIKRLFTNNLPKAYLHFVETLVDVFEKVYDALKMANEIYENGGYEKDLSFVISANEYLSVVKSPWGEAVGLIKLEQNDNLLELYCVDCEARVALKLSGQFVFDGKQESYGAAVTFDGDLTVSLLVGVHAQTKSMDVQKALTLFDIPIGPIEIPGILNIGTNLRMDVGTSLDIKSAANVLIGGIATFGQMRVGLGLGSLKFETQQNSTWEPKVDPILNIKTRVQVKGSVYADLMLGVEFKILDWSSMAGMKGRVNILAEAVASIDDTPGGWQNYTRLPRTIARSSSGSSFVTSIMKSDSGKNKKMDGVTKMLVNSRKKVQQRDLKPAEHSATMSPDSTVISRTPPAASTIAYSYSINTNIDPCQNGVQLSLAVAFEFSFFAGEFKSSLAKLSIPVYNATCFPLLEGPSKRSLERQHQLSIDRAPDLRLYSADHGNLYMVHANETSQKFSTDTSEKLDDVHEYVAKDVFNRYFTIFNTVKEQGVSRIRMYKRDQYPVGTERVVFVHFDNVTAVVNTRNGDVYVPVACMNELGGLQLFVMSPIHNIDPENITEVINGARNPPLVPHAGVTDCVPVNLVLT